MWGYLPAAAMLLHSPNRDKQAGTSCAEGEWMTSSIPEFRQQHSVPSPGLMVRLSLDHHSMCCFLYQRNVFSLLSTHLVLTVINVAIMGRWALVALEKLWGHQHSTLRAIIRALTHLGLSQALTIISLGESSVRDETTAIIARRTMPAYFRQRPPHIGS